MSSYWPSLGTYVEGLDKAGKLVRVTTPINKDTELHPLVRLQFRGLPESQRLASLPSNTSGRRERTAMAAASAQKRVGPAPMRAGRPSARRAAAIVAISVPWMPRRPSASK